MQKKKMTKPLPTDVQMLALMKEDHAMNNKLFEKMDSMDEAMKSSMESFSGDVQSLNQTLAGGFAMLIDILQQPGPSHFHSLSMQMVTIFQTCKTINVSF